MNTPDPLFRLRNPDGATYGPAAMATIVQWAREGRVDPEAWLIPADGGPERPAREEPPIAAILRAPPMVRGPSPRHEDDDGGISTIIPYRNGPALAGYYFGVFSLVPIFAVLLGPIAVGLGIWGLRTARRKEGAKGTAHAVVAIVLGTLTFGAHAVLAVMLFMRL